MYASRHPYQLLFSIINEMLWSGFGAFLTLYIYLYHFTKVNNSSRQTDPESALMPTEEWMGCHRLNEYFDDQVIFQEKKRETKSFFCYFGKQRLTNLHSINQTTS